MIFLLGIAMPLNVFVGFIYAMEFLPEKKTSLASAVVMGNDSLVMFLTSLWFLLVSKNWKTLYATATVLMYCVHIFVWRMPESPKFLLTKARFAEARSVI